MTLGIAAELSAPPSSPTTFREVTMYAKVFHHFDVVAFCLDGEQDFYAPWFRQYGLWDYVADLVPRDQLKSLSVEISGPSAKLTAFNVHDVLRLIGRVQKRS